MPRWVTTLRVLAALIGLRGFLNLFRPLGYGTGFVAFGVLLKGEQGAWIGFAVGIVLLIYAYGAWTLKRWSLPMAVAYAAFVALNIPLFAVFNPVPNEARYWLFGILFLLGGVGVTAGAAWILYAHRHQLR